MFSPPDLRTETRMLTARDNATFLLEARPSGHVVWGWRGRTVGCKVDTNDGPAWLRIQSASKGKSGGRIWDGTLTAATEIPNTVPRPALLATHDWTVDQYDYRAELTSFVPSPACSPDPFLRRELDLPDQWWASLRNSLTAISGIDTDRVTISQAYLDRALPTYLEAPNIPTVPARWATSHGDCHWTNLTKDGPTLLDWEGWGQTPAGYDAALLATYSIAAPEIEARVRSELASMLDTPEGRFAELTVLAELIQTTGRGDNLDVESALRRRARQLLRIGAGRGTGIAAFQPRSSSTARASRQEP